MNDPDAFDPNAPTDDLVSFALSHPAGDPYWDAISALYRRGTREVFDAANRLLASACPIERKLGANIHAQLGWAQGKPFAAESIRLLTRVLSAEDDTDVIAAILFAFGHLHEPECAPAVIGFANHPDEDVRYAAAFALPLVGDEDEQAIAALIVLSTDPVVKVRDWATFALGSQTEWDSPALRAALRARLSDSDSETRGEALRGLARVRDACAVEAVLAELGGPDPHECAVDAAETLADPRLVPALEALRGRGFRETTLESAIKACRTGG